MGNPLGSPEQPYLLWQYSPSAFDVSLPRWGAGLGLLRKPLVLRTGGMSVDPRRGGTRHRKAGRADGTPTAELGPSSRDCWANG
jgi:hypothetical protein